jgi:hypothetical protein
MPAPKSEEVLSLTRVESLAHLLNTALRILVEAPLELTAHMLSDLII